MEPTMEASEEATHEPMEGTEEATEEATGEATHEATGEATHEHEGTAVPEEYEDLENPYADDPAAAEAGREVYMTNCALCHGDTGNGDGPAAAGLPEKPAKFADCEWMAGEEDGEFFYIIVTGRADDGMPAWGETLTEDQIWQAISFVHTFCE